MVGPPGGDRGGWTVATVAMVAGIAGLGWHPAVGQAGL